MTANDGRTEALLMRMQDAFLERPGLKLTLAKARQRFGVDETTCEAVLEALVDASVLDKTHEGAYVRRFPRLVNRAPQPPGLGDHGSHTRPVATHAA